MATATPTPLPSDVATFRLPKAAVDAIARIEAALSMSPADHAAHRAASYVRTAPADELAAALAEDNRLEDAGMHADERRTCWTHQGWADDCAFHPMHADPHGYTIRQALRSAS